MTSTIPPDEAGLLNGDLAIAAAPLPTEQTIRARQNLFIQAIRFVILNFRIMRMVLKGDH